jgi:hypothetical protein
MARHADPLRVRRPAYGALAWLAFAVTWWFVLRRDPRAWLPDLAVPVVTVVVVTVLTLAWVKHNLRIYRRKGPRRGRPDPGGPWRTDSLGRRLQFARSSKTASVVTVSVRGGVKRYEAAP